MKKQITAREAFAQVVKTKHAHKPIRAQIINECPDCSGTGKVNKQDCPTCGNEPDYPQYLKKIGGYWYKK